MTNIILTIKKTEIQASMLHFFIFKARYDTHDEIYIICANIDIDLFGILQHSSMQVIVQRLVKKLVYQAERSANNFESFGANMYQSNVQTKSLEWETQVLNI